MPGQHVGLQSPKKCHSGSQKLEELPKQGPPDSSDDIFSEILPKHSRAIHDRAWNTFMTFAAPQGTPGEMDYGSTSSILSIQP